MFGNRHMNIGHSCHLFLVGDEHHLMFIFLVSLHEVADKGSGVVSGCIVNDDHAVIIVVLIEDGLKVEFVAEIFGVVVGGDDDTKRQFSCVLAHMINGFQPLFLFFKFVLDIL